MQDVLFIVTFVTDTNKHAKLQSLYG